MHKNIHLKEIMKALPRGKFDKIVSNHQGDKYSKGFSCWDQLICMVYGQLSGSFSLRDIELSFNEREHCHYHLGTRHVSRSTLSYANSHRPVSVYEDVLSFLNSQLIPSSRKHMRDILKIFDSTSIPLAPEIYKDIGANNGRINGLKLHIEYSANDGAPTYHEITKANINDIEVGKRIPIIDGATYTFDKGYMDLGWWQSLHEKRCRFISRIQKHMPFEVIEERKAKGQNIIRDCVISLSGLTAKNKIFIKLRLIKLELETGKIIEIVSNDTLSPASDIADIYRRRWEIEVLFKWIKQNLKIKRFIGTSENAVKIQIVTALIAYVLIAIYRRKYKQHTSLRQCLLLIRFNMFEQTDYKQRYRKMQKYRKLNINQESFKW